MCVCACVRVCVPACIGFTYIHEHACVFYFCLKYQNVHMVCVYIPHTHVHTRTHTYTYIHRCTQTHACTCTCKHMYTCTSTCTHIYAFWYLVNDSRHTYIGQPETRNEVKGNTCSTGLPSPHNFLEPEGHFVSGLYVRSRDSSHHRL